jgi:hypothetical protein
LHRNAGIVVYLVSVMRSVIQMVGLFFETILRIGLLFFVSREHIRGVSFVQKRLLTRADCFVGTIIKANGLGDICSA